MPTLKCGKIIVDHHLNSPGIRKTAAVEVILIVLLSVAIYIYFCYKKPNLHSRAPNPAGASTHPSLSMLACVMCSRAQLG